MEKSITVCYDTAEKGKGYYVDVASLDPETYDANNLYFSRFKGRANRKAVKLGHI